MSRQSYRVCIHFISNFIMYVYTLDLYYNKNINENSLEILRINK